MRRGALVPIVLLTLAACGDDGGGSPESGGTDTSAVDVELERQNDNTTSPTTVAPKPDVSVPDEPPGDGIEITEIEEGDGPEARQGDYVEVRYVGVSIRDGEEFDSNYDQSTALEVTIGAGQVIQGFDEGLVGISKGEIRQIDIPANLAYGQEGQGQGQGNAPPSTPPPEGEGPVLPDEGDEGGEVPPASPPDDAGEDTAEAEPEGFVASPDTTTSEDEAGEAPGDDPEDVEQEDDGGASGESGDQGESGENGEGNQNGEGQGGQDQGGQDQGQNGQGQGGQDQGGEDEGPPRGPLSFVVEAEQVLRRPSVEDVVEPSSDIAELDVDERQEGSGDEVEEGDSLRVHLVMLRGDNLFEMQNSWNQGAPATIQLVASADQGGIPEGLVEGLQGMKPGGRRVVTIPPDLAYGDEGLPQLGLPQDTDLIFLVDLIEIV